MLLNNWTQAKISDLRRQVTETAGTAIVHAQQLAETLLSADHFYSELLWRYRMNSLQIFIFRLGEHIMRVRKNKKEHKKRNN